MRILIDGDVIAHKVAARVGDRVEFPDLADQVEAEVESWCRIGDPTDPVVVCLSEDRSFRYWVWPRYKENRQGKPRPPMLAAAYEALRGMYDCWSVPGLEGDDCLGILATPIAWEPTEDGIRCVSPLIVTIDKDLQQVPGQHFNPDKDEEIRLVTEPEASWAFHLQWLMGDPGDCLPGVPGIGPKKAARLLGGVYDNSPNGSPDEWRAIVQQAYADHGLSEEYCRQMERCVRVLTRRDYAE